MENIGMIDIRDCFEKRFKVILERDPYCPDNTEMMDWINLNSNGNVQVKFLQVWKKDDRWVTGLSTKTIGKDRAFIAFENTDDALFFKIKYLT